MFAKIISAAAGLSERALPFSEFVARTKFNSHNRLPGQPRVAILIRAFDSVTLLLGSVLEMQLKMPLILILCLSCCNNGSLQFFSKFVFLLTPRKLFNFCHVILISSSISDQVVVNKSLILSCPWSKLQKIAFLCV